MTREMIQTSSSTRVLRKNRNIIRKKVKEIILMKVNMSNCSV
jgi:hypothetical protein